MFSEPSWQALAGTRGAWEAEWWGLEWPRDDAQPSTPASALFRDAGVAVMRAGRDHCLFVTNGVVGTKGFGNHKHNDQLSFEYHHGGVPLVVDPGSFVYTSDFDARNRFRRTSSHNTVQVDGEEQNELKPDWIFRLFETSSAEHVSFAETADCVEYVGRHHGYERFDRPVLHERTLRLSKRDGALTVVDMLRGQGEHLLRWHFHLAPAVDATQVSPATVQLSVEQRRWTLRVPDDLAVSIGTAGYSPSYGVQRPCRTVDVEARVRLDGDRTWTFSIT
jgi:uncharacterized heparinase superfamily protein